MSRPDVWTCTLETGLQTTEVIHYQSWEAKPVLQEEEEKPNVVRGRWDRRYFMFDAEVEIGLHMNVLILPHDMHHRIDEDAQEM